MEPIKDHLKTCTKQLEQHSGAVPVALVNSARNPFLSTPAIDSRHFQTLTVLQAVSRLQRHRRSQRKWTIATRADEETRAHSVQRQRPGTKLYRFEEKAHARGHIRLSYSRSRDLFQALSSPIPTSL
ncbi:hypothetical protein A0H81_07907 [Grifola frondosa]|uniref:Uncharacterized protein n=1 Tax=Grifola frondosa TaxID=5627 RepID=A0A1C7M7C6_GRIFR|nr:hypothetical protein A0H81_07907 [Grifola frondosa]